MSSLVSVNKSREVVTTSLQIAETFGKEHRHVLEAIRNLAAENSAAKSYFVESTYVNRGKEYPMYYMGRDGFSLLVMGFTGEKALDFKMQYIEAFNTMEKKLSEEYQSAIPKNFAQALMLAAKQQEEIERAQLLITEQNEQIHEMTNAISEMQVKVSYVDKVLACKSTVKITTIAQDYGMSAKAFNERLHELGIQYKVGSQWILYAKHLSMGYVQSKSFEFKRKDGTLDVNYNTEWTQKGRLFLYEELKRNDVLPLIEKMA